MDTDTDLATTSQLLARITELEALLSERDTEFSDFQETSKEIEAEQERELNRLAQENAHLKSRADHLQHDMAQRERRTQSNLAALNSALEASKAELERTRADLAVYRQRTVELEQENDMLHSRRRELESTLCDTQSRCNKLLEEKAELETELELKSQLEVDVQRCREEIRDLQNELDVRERRMSSRSAISSSLALPSPSSTLSRASSLSPARRLPPGPPSRRSSQSHATHIPMDTEATRESFSSAFRGDPSHRHGLGHGQHMEVVALLAPKHHHMNVHADPHSDSTMRKSSPQPMVVNGTEQLSPAHPPNGSFASNDACRPMGAQDTQAIMRQLMDRFKVRISRLLPAPRRNFPPASR